MGIGKVFGITGRATKAIEIYNRAITILEMSRGAECEDLVVPLCALGNLFIKEERITDAEISFKRSFHLSSSFLLVITCVASVAIIFILLCIFLLQ